MACLAANKGQNDKLWVKTSVSGIIENQLFREYPLSIEHLNNAALNIKSY